MTTIVEEPEIPLNMLANGTVARPPTLSYQAPSYNVRTGGLPAGTGSAEGTCQNWTSTAGQGAVSSADGTAFSLSVPCSSPARVFCLEE